MSYLTRPKYQYRHVCVRTSGGSFVGFCMAVIIYQDIKYTSRKLKLYTRLRFFSIDNVHRFLSPILCDDTRLELRGSFACGKMGLAALDITPT
jgi:hypothetical protein